MRTPLILNVAVRLRGWLALLLFGCPAAAPAGQWRDTLGGPAVGESLALESRSAIRRGMNFLLDRQLPDGSLARHPALTGLAVLALLNAPGELRSPASAAAAERAAGWLRRRLAAETDAPIAGETPPRPILHLAVGSWALMRLGQPADRPLLREVRTRLLAAQCLDLPEGDPNCGGFRPHPGAAPDFMTTTYALETLQLMEAMALNTAPDSGSVAPRPQVISPAADWLWRWLAANPGMAPSVQASAADVAPAPPALRPSLTGLQAAALLKSLFYAGATAADARVGSLCAWFGRRADFAENPGAGDAGYYTYIFTLAQALRGCERQGMFFNDAATNRGKLPLPLNTCADWRRHTVEALLKRQAGDGGWHQSSPDWWETRPELTTAYALLAMELAL